MIQIAELYPEVLLPEASADVHFEAWLDLARQCLHAAWMHCFEGRCYFYRLGEIHEYSDCLVSVQLEPEIQYLDLAQVALEQALAFNPRHAAAQYSFCLVKWLLSPGPEVRQQTFEKWQQIPAFPAEPNRSSAFLQRAQTHTAALLQPTILAIKQDPALRDSLGFDLPLPEFPLHTLLQQPLSAAENAKAFAARLRLLLGEYPAFTPQMSWRIGLIRMLMDSEKWGQAGFWQITCFGPLYDPFYAQAEVLGQVQTNPQTEEASFDEADLVTLWHLSTLAADTQSQIQLAWQGLKRGGLLLAAFSRSEVEPTDLRRALTDLTGAEADLIDRESFSDRLVVAIWKKAQVPVEMRVLILMRPDSALSFGGADLQMFRSRARLRQLGVQTDISLACRLDFETYDLIYAVGYLHEQYQFRLLQTTTKPVVGMPIATLFYLESALAEEIFRQIHLQVGSHFKQASAVSPHLLQWLQNWRMDALWQKVSGDWQKTGMKAKIDKISGQFAKVCDFLVPQASAEISYLMAHSQKPLPNFRLLPNGCDPELFTQADPSLFERSYGLKDFLLCVGRIEPNKNQLLLCYALRETDIPIVLVGKESADLFQDYLALCQYLGNGRIHVLQDLSDAMLASAYAAAKLFVLPSASESFPLSTLEAAWAGCPVVLSQNSVQAEFAQDLFYTLDPLDPVSIRNVIETAWQADNVQRISAARALVQSHCTWEQMAQDLKLVFVAVQHMSPREKGFQLVWQGECIREMAFHLVPPSEKQGLERVYRLADLSPVWELNPEQRKVFLQQSFEVYSDLAQVYLQTCGFLQVQVLPLLRVHGAMKPLTPPTQAALSGPHLLCFYHPQGLYGHRETLSAFLSVYAADSPARLTLYLPTVRESSGVEDLDAVETELIAQIVELGFDPENIPELAVLGGGLVEGEEQNLFASANLIVFPLKRLWGQEDLLARVLTAGVPLLTHGFMANWPDQGAHIDVLTPFQALSMAAPLDMIEIETAQLVAHFQSLEVAL